MPDTLIFLAHSMAPEKVDEYMRKGRMPNLKELVEKGASGETRSVFSTISPADYTSALTGVTPSTHGIHGFQNLPEGFDMPRTGQGGVVEDRRGETETRPYTSYDVGSEWVWELIDSRSIQMGVFSPSTYPAPDIEGNIWVSGYWNHPAPYLKDLPAACNDQDFRQKLLERFPNHRVTYPIAVPPAYPENVESEKGYLENMLEFAREESEKIHAQRVDVMKNEEGKYFVTEEGLLDYVQHLLWPRSDANPYSDQVDSWLRERDLLGDYYSHIDDMIGRYLEELGDDVNVIVFSPHGQEEGDEGFSFHDRFRKLYSAGIWEIPEGWEFRDEKPDWEPLMRAENSRRGFYAFSGSDFERKDSGPSISCMDLTPVILELEGEDIPLHLDGELPEEVFIHEG